MDSLEKPRFEKFESIQTHFWLSYKTDIAVEGVL